MHTEPRSFLSLNPNLGYPKSNEISDRPATELAKVKFPNSDCLLFVYVSGIYVIKLISLSERWGARPWRRIHASNDRT